MSYGESYELEEIRDFDEHCDDMLQWAVQNQIDDLRKNMHKDRLAVTAERIRGLAQQKTIELMSKRLDKILSAFGGTATPSRKER